MFASYLFFDNNTKKAFDEISGNAARLGTCANNGMEVDVYLPGDNCSAGNRITLAYRRYEVRDDAVALAVFHHGDGAFQVL